MSIKIYIITSVNRYIITSVKRGMSWRCLAAQRNVVYQNNVGTPRS